MKSILILALPILLGLAVANETENGAQSPIVQTLSPETTTESEYIMFVKPMKNNHTAIGIKNLADSLSSAADPLSWQLSHLPRQLKLTLFRFKRDVEASWSHGRIQPRIWPPFYEVRDESPLNFQNNGTAPPKPGYFKLMFVIIHHLWKDSSKYKLGQLMKGNFDGGNDDRK
ncbi:hypothetical protein KR067_003190 [Drosophila pandora]|nr:hypothetical protein KR067_003190 [Drosophila pandora]